MGIELVRCWVGGDYGGEMGIFWRGLGGFGVFQAVYGVDAWSEAYLSAGLYFMALERR